MRRRDGWSQTWIASLTMIGERLARALSALVPGPGAEPAPGLAREPTREELDHFFRRLRDR